MLNHREFRHGKPEVGSGLSAVKDRELEAKARAVAREIAGSGRTELTGSDQLGYAKGEDKYMSEGGINLEMNEQDIENSQDRPSKEGPLTLHPERIVNPELQLRVKEFQRRNLDQLTIEQLKKEYDSWITEEGDKDPDSVRASLAIRSLIITSAIKRRLDISRILTDPDIENKVRSNVVARMDIGEELSDEEIQLRIALAERSKTLPESVYGAQPGRSNQRKKKTGGGSGRNSSGQPPRNANNPSPDRIQQSSMPEDVRIQMETAYKIARDELDQRHDKGGMDETDYAKECEKLEFPMADAGLMDAKEYYDNQRSRLFIYLDTTHSLMDFRKSYSELKEWGRQRGVGEVPVTEQQQKQWDEQQGEAEEVVYSNNEKNFYVGSIGGLIQERAERILTGRTTGEVGRQKGMKITPEEARTYYDDLRRYVGYILDSVRDGDLRISEDKRDHLQKIYYTQADKMLSLDEIRRETEYLIGGESKTQGNIKRFFKGQVEEELRIPQTAPEDREQMMMLIAGTYGFEKWLYDPKNRLINVETHEVYMHNFERWIREREMEMEDHNAQKPIDPLSNIHVRSKTGYSANVSLVDMLTIPKYMQTSRFRIKGDDREPEAEEGKEDSVKVEGKKQDQKPGLAHELESLLNKDWTFGNCHNWRVAYRDRRANAGEFNNAMSSIHSKNELVRGDLLLNLILKMSSCDAEEYREFMENGIQGRSGRAITFGTMAYLHISEFSNNPDRRIEPTFKGGKKISEGNMFMKTMGHKGMNEFYYSLITDALNSNKATKEAYRDFVMKILDDEKKNYELKPGVTESDKERTQREDIRADIQNVIENIKARTIDLEVQLRSLDLLVDLRMKIYEMQRKPEDKPIDRTVVEKEVGAEIRERIKPEYIEKIKALEMQQFDYEFDAKTDKFGNRKKKDAAGGKYRAVKGRKKAKVKDENEVDVQVALGELMIPNLDIYNINKERSIYQGPKDEKPTYHQEDDKDGKNDNTMRKLGVYLDLLDMDEDFDPDSADKGNWKEILENNEKAALALVAGLMNFDRVDLNPFNKMDKEQEVIDLINNAIRRGVCRRKEVDLDEDEGGYAMRYVINMLDFTGIVAFNDTEGIGFDIWARLQQLERYRLGQANAKSSAGNLLTIGELNALSIPLWMALKVKGPGESEALETLLEVMQGGQGDKIDLKKSLDKNYSFESPQAQSKFVDLHLNNALEFFKLLMEKQNTGLDKIAKTDEDGNVLVDKVALRGIMTTWWKQLRYATDMPGFNYDKDIVFEGQKMSVLEFFFGPKIIEFIKNDMNPDKRGIQKPAKGVFAYIFAKEAQIHTEPRRSEDRWSIETLMQIEKAFREYAEDLGIDENERPVLGRSFFTEKEWDAILDAAGSPYLKLFTIDLFVALLSGTLTGFLEGLKQTSGHVGFKPN